MPIKWLRCQRPDDVLVVTIRNAQEKQDWLNLLPIKNPCHPHHVIFTVASARYVSKAKAARIRKRERS